MKKLFKNKFISLFILEILFDLIFLIVFAFYIILSKISISTVSFFYPFFLFFLLLIPFYYYIILLTKNKSEQQLSKYFDESIKNKMFVVPSSFLWIWKVFLMRTVFFFLIIALSQPIIGTKIKKIDSKNVEIVLALDVSNSMNTKDLSQNFSRLDIVKRALIQFLNQLSGEKIGISVFAGASYVQLPITEDYSAAKLFVNEISSTMISNQGTDISAAIQTAKNMFSEKKCNKIVLLMTDGEHHEGDLSESTEDIQQKELQFLVVGIGSKTGGFIPKVADRPEFGYKKDENSQNVVSKLNKNLIIDIAKQTHGSYTFINNSFPDIYHFFTSIKKSKSFQNSIEKNSIEMKVRKRFYSYFLLFSGGFLILFFLLNSLFYKKEKD